MNKKSIPSIAKGLFVSFLITALVFTIYCALITYTSISDKYIQAVVMASTAVSVITGGFLSTGGAEKGGWLCGLLCGLMYAVLIISIGFTLNPELKFNAKIIQIMIFSLIGGAVGGIAGINLKNVCK